MIPVLWVDPETGRFWIQAKEGIKEAPQQYQDKLNRIFSVKKTG